MSDDVDELEPEQLPARHRRFVEAYMGEAKGKGVRAAELAGYAGDGDTLAVTASRLLRSAKVRAAIDARLEADPLVASRAERVRWLTAVMRGEVAGDNLRERLAAQEALSKLAGEQVTKVAHTDAKGEDLKDAPIGRVFELAALGKGE